MDFSFFTTDNKSGYKTNEKWLMKNYPDVYDNITSYNEKIGIEMSFKEKIWFYFNNLTNRPKCKTCGKEIKFRERFDKPYGDFCSLECINTNKEEMINRQKKTFKKKYNVDFYPQHVDFIKKQKETKYNRYGDENYVNVEKSKKTKLKKYGNENYINIEKTKNTSFKKYGVDNYSKSKEFKNKIKDNFKLLYPDVNFVEIDKSMVKIKCNKCHGIFEINKQLLYERKKRNQDICILCNPIGISNKSTYENELSEFLTSISIEHKTKVMKILKKHEIDIFIPNYNIGIEIDGVYWHNELFVNNDYHLKKTIESNLLGISLLHIFEDEWNYKKDIVKSIIKNRLGKTNNIIYARKCVIKEIEQKTTSEFLERNHIQGNVNSKIRIGLFYNNNLVSVMTFSKGRVIMSGKNNEWELTRFCSKLDHNIIGGANKLFKYFLKKYTPIKIISYSDVRLFDGGLYVNLGFKKIKQSSPNYWYVINGIRHYRFNFRKSILVKNGYDPNKTEKEIMFERKIYRIYDCGQIRWEYNVL